MADEDKDLFREFINSLPSLNGLGNQPVPSKDKADQYAEALRIEFGLTPNKEAQMVIADIYRRYEEFNWRYLDQTLLFYLKIFLWDILRHNPHKPLDTMFVAFLCGVLFGDLVEWEDIPPEPE